MRQTSDRRGRGEGIPKRSQNRSLVIGQQNGNSGRRIIALLFLVWGLVSTSTSIRADSLDTPSSSFLDGLVFDVVAALEADLASAASPSITSVSLDSAAPGTTIVLTGSNFGSNAGATIVRFGAVRAEIVSLNDTSLETIVPVGASYDFISVTSENGKTAYSAKPFIPKFSPVATIADRSFGQQSSYPPSPTKPALVNLSTGYSSSPTMGVKICDLDGDGKPDIVAANRNNDNVIVFSNTGTYPSGDLATSSFAIVTTISTGTRPTDLAIGDLNGDGKPDIVIANSSGNSLSLLQNTSTPGAISFAPAITFPIPYQSYDLFSTPSSVKLVDIDGDGWLDIAMGGLNVGVLRNKGLGGTLSTSSFNAAVSFYLNASPVNDFAVGDLDGDGKPDVAVATYFATVFILQNTSTPGTISFAQNIQIPHSSTPYALAIVDLNGDGKPELLSGGNSLSLIPNQSQPGPLSAASFGSRIDLGGFLYVRRLSVGDLNGDGLPDLVITRDFPGGINVYLNGGTGNAATTLTRMATLNIPTGNYGIDMATRTAIGDLNGDGKPDLVVDGSWGSILVSQNFGVPLTATSFSISPTSPSVTFPWYRATRLSAKQVMSDTSTVYVTGGANWTSSAPSVAAIDSYGLLVGVAIGTTTVQASCDGLPAQATVSVQSTAFGRNPGNPDGQFLPSISNGGFIGSVKAMAVQTDGKVIIGGVFSMVNGVACNNLARLNADGSLDSSFAIGTGPNGAVKGLALDNAGNILVVGAFTSINGVTRKAAARLTPSGAVDTTFNFNLTTDSSLQANVILVRPNGKILIGGYHLETAVSSTPSFLIQLNASGTLDSTFNAVGSSSSETNTLALQPDGFVLVGGSLARTGSTDPFCLARLDLTGAFDPTFQIGIESSRVYSIALQSDGKIVAAGDFSSVFGQSVKFLTRLNADGTLDSSFSNTSSDNTSIIQAVAVQKNGKIVFGRSFDTKRLDANGAPDPSYVTSSKPDWAISTIVITPDEKIWTMGGNSTVNGLSTMGIAWLHGDVSTLQGWYTRYFTSQEASNPLISGPAAQPHNDGVANVMKYLCHIDPSAALGEADKGALPVTSVIEQDSKEYLTLQHRQNPAASDLNIEVQVSTDLKTWQTVTPDNTQTVGTDPLTGDPIIQYQVDTLGAEQKFIRLNVTAP